MAIASTMRMGAEGIKVVIGGRLNELRSQEERNSNKEGLLYTLLELI